MVFMKEFLEKLILKKVKQSPTKSMENYPACKVAFHTVANYYHRSCKFHFSTAEEAFYQNSGACQPISIFDT